jgi:hypothetical protein
MNKAQRIKIPKQIAIRYAGLTAAVVGDKVVAAGATTTEAIAKAKKQFPKVKEEEIAVMTLPPKTGVWVL